MPSEGSNNSEKKLPNICTHSSHLMRWRLRFALWRSFKVCAKLSLFSRIQKLIFASRRRRWRSAPTSWDIHSINILLRNNFVENNPTLKNTTELLLRFSCFCLSSLGSHLVIIKWKRVIPWLISSSPCVLMLQINSNWVFLLHHPSRVIFRNCSTQRWLKLITISTNHPETILGLGTLCGVELLRERRKRPVESNRGTRQQLCFPGRSDGRVEWWVTSTSSCSEEEVSRCRTHVYRSTIQYFCSNGLSNHSVEERWCWCWSRLYKKRYMRKTGSGELWSSKHGIVRYLLNRLRTATGFGDISQSVV